jgi:hypothetical protein
VSLTTTTSKKKAEPTPQQRLFQSLYVGLQKKWTRSRYLLLCNKLNYNRYELGWLFGLKESDIDSYIKKNKFPNTVCRHFENIDRFTDIMRGKKPPPCAWQDFMDEL